MYVAVYNLGVLIIYSFTCLFQGVVFDLPDEFNDTVKVSIHMM